MYKTIRLTHGGICAVLFLIVLLIFSFLSPVLAYIPILATAQTNPAPSSSSYVHFSIDDTIDLFHDLTVNESTYDSIFDQPDLAFFKKLHDEYGIVVTFYCFYSWDTKSGMFNLSEATDTFASDFTANSDWLRFGFHAWDAPSYESLTPETEVQWYTQTLKELLRITGSENCIDHFLRLDRYTADEATVQSLHMLPDGVTGLLCPDPGSSSPSYALTAEEAEKLYQDDWYTDEGGISYTPTDLRFEAIPSVLNFYQQLDKIAGQNQLVVFTHAWFLQDPEIQRYISWFAKYGQSAGYQFDFVHACSDY